MSLEGLVGVREAPSVLRSIGIVPGKKYDPAEFQRLLTQSKADKLRVQGYVLRVDLEGKVSVVHWTKADDFQSTMRDEWRAHRQEPGKPMMDTAGGWDGSKDPVGPPVQAGSLGPVKKRTPQERVDSLMARWIEDCMRTGTVPGLDDPMLATILDLNFQAGRTNLTAENVRTVVAHFLAEAEKKKEAANRKLIVRPPHGS